MSIEKENFNDSHTTHYQDPLNNPALSVKEYFSSFIKTKSVEELIAYDNKLFSEIRNLESEKHILVTQNYKKFVAATETINTIKSSLVGFEKDLYSLQNKIGSMVQNFNTVNTTIEDKLKETQEIYKVKKDLKRLKFINDLPAVLENQLIQFLKSDPRDIKLLEKSLNYYEKCKHFLHLYKNNSLVKSIYQKTNELIFRYRQIIQDELHIPDFNEFKLETFDTCISLLVKIEEDKSELISTFLDRYKFLINKKFDEVFGMRDGVLEINFSTYSKIYDNFEFAINENEFLFYEHQISVENSNYNEIQTNLNQISLNLNIKNLTSKYFKKGSFIWVCKKTQEQIISQFIELAYRYFTKNFEKQSSHFLNGLYQYIIDIFYKKIKDILESEKFRKENFLDPVFFKEGLTNFYISFCESMQRINDENIESSIFEEKILNNNKNLTELYLNNLLEGHVVRILEVIKTPNYMLGENMNINMSIPSKNNSNFFFHSQFEKLFQENSSLNNKLITIFIEDISMLKKLDFAELFNISPDEANRVHLKAISNFISIYFFILKSTNLLRFDSLSIHNSFLNNDGLLRVKSKIKEYFPNCTKERIFFKIILCKLMSNSNFSGLKNLIDKILREFPQIKSNKIFYTELKNNMEKDLSETLTLLNDSIVQIYDIELNKKLVKLFLDVNWLKYDMAITFRKDVRDLCYELYFLKTELNELLEDEKKYFEETVSSTLNQAIWNKKNKRNSKYQNEMECLNIRRLSIYTSDTNSPQMIIYTIAKIFLKAVNEYVKLKKFSKGGFQQIQLDLNLIKYFFKENLIIDVENILDGFFMETVKNTKFNALDMESFDESLISGLIEEHRKEFKAILKNLNAPQE